jgi:hypothetical protein
VKMPGWIWAWLVVRVLLLGDVSVAAFKMKSKEANSCWLRTFEFDSFCDGREWRPFGLDDCNFNFSSSNKETIGQSAAGQHMRDGGIAGYFHRAILWLSPPCRRSFD